MKNIHLIKTDKPSRLWVNNLRRRYELETEPLIGSNTAQHIYITNDEEIEEGDWHVLKDGDYKGELRQLITKPSSPYISSKVILTTDIDLIKNGIQAIDDEFLEWFVKNPSCESVEVKEKQHFEADKSKRINPLNGVYYSYKIIIPQEESKQEWNPTQGEEVWIKVFSNWSKGTYIGYDVTKQTHIVREDEKGGGNLFSSTEVLPYYAMPNEQKQETLELKRNYQKHSLTKTKGYKLWCNIIQRCYNPKNHSYKYYGEKGVVMEDYFKNSYENFIDWIKGIANYDKWLNSSELSLDRIDNTLGYIRGNIKFSTKTEQVENQNLRIDNKSGYKGVCYHKLNKKYGATITINKSKVFLGYYDTALEAALVYDNYVLKNNLNRKTNL
jgi:hypothetical protein